METKLLRWRLDLADPEASLKSMLLTRTMKSICAKGMQDFAHFDDLVDFNIDASNPVSPAPR